MVKRQLTEDELTLTLKGGERLEQQLFVKGYSLKRIQLQLDEGLKATQIELQNELKHLTTEIREQTVTLNNLKDQVLNGVEVKEATDAGPTLIQALDDEVTKDE